MIRLTPYEQQMLDGAFGTAKQVALQKMLDYAQILGAEELVPITKAHLCCGSTCEPSDFPDGNLDRPDILAMGYHDWQTKLKCPGLEPDAFNSFNESTYVMDDVHCCDTFQWQWTQQTKEFYENNRQILSDAADRGVMIGSTCAPYLAGSTAIPSWAPGAMAAAATPRSAPPSAAGRPSGASTCLKTATAPTCSIWPAIPGTRPTGICWAPLWAAVWRPMPFLSSAAISSGPT